MKRNILLIGFVGGMIFSPFFFTQAAVGVSPVTFELTANPGDVIVNQLKVYNPSTDTVLGIKMEVEDIAPTGETGHVTVEPAETETYSIARWVKTEPEEFTLGPREEKFVTFTITVPENVEPGGHYGVILAGTKGVTRPGAVGATIVERVGALVLLTTPGETKEELVVKDFTAPHYSEYGPINFTVRFENKGTVHVKPVASITITNWLGKKVSEIQLPQRNVLPDAVRKLEVSWNKKWLFAGKYTATLTGNYGISHSSLSSAVITFWAFPWKVGIGILLIILFFVLTRKRWTTAFRVLLKGEKILEADKG